MNKLIVALGVMLALGTVSQTQTHMTKVATAQVPCEVCSCGYYHINEQNGYVDAAPVAPKKRGHKSAEAAFAEAAGTVIGAVAGVLAIVCLLTVAPQATILFGFLWLCFGVR